MTKITKLYNVGDSTVIRLSRGYRDYLCVSLTSKLAGWIMDSSISQVVVGIGKIINNVVSILGTGFAVGTNKIATAAHVVGQDDDGLVILHCKVRSLDDYQDTTDQSVSATPVKLTAYDPIKDLAILDCPPELKFRLGYVISGADHAPPSTPVVSLGFPHADSGRFVLTQHRTFVGARVLLGSSGVKAKQLILNTQARPGQSGSPIFVGEGKSLSVCAMLIGSYAPPFGGSIMVGVIDPQILHQTTHAISSEYIKDML